MAAKSTLFLFLFLAAQLVVMHGGAAAVSREVGGRREVDNVRSNKEIQNLGRYCVEENNRRIQQKGNGSSGELLVFSEVVGAETQVVSGIKYYLRISAATSGGVAESFEAVVLVKPWTRSKELVRFDPWARSF